MFRASGDRTLENDADADASKTNGSGTSTPVTNTLDDVINNRLEQVRTIHLMTQNVCKIHSHIPHILAGFPKSTRP